MTCSGSFASTQSRPLIHRLYCVMERDMEILRCVYYYLCIMYCLCIYVWLYYARGSVSDFAAIDVCVMYVSVMYAYTDVSSKGY